MVKACELQYDAAVLGNHEFNYGLPYLRKAIQESRFPWLSANTVDASTGAPLFGTPYIVRELNNGARIGVLGLTTAYIPNWELPQHIVGIRFDDPVTAARKWVSIMKNEEQVDVIIVSYHGGFERDLESGLPTETLTGENVGYAICEQVEGIDVLLTGHQHRAIAGYKVNKVCVVQPAIEGRFLGKVTLQIDKSTEGWVITNSQSELIDAAHYKPDAGLERIIRPVESLVQTWLDQPIGTVEGNMVITSPADVRLNEHPMIEFIHRVQMDASGASISSTALFDNSAPGFSKRITMREIVSNYVYPNTLKVLRISGQDIRDALEKSAEYFELHAEGDIGVSRMFDVVMSNYRAGGGGNYLMFQGKEVVREINMDMIELLADYIRKHARIYATVNKNWIVVNAQ